MTSDQITDIILAELKSDFKISNTHGVDLKKCLITPIQQEYFSAMDTTIKFNLWTVLEESEDGDGYKIFFDEDENTVGLGMKSANNQLLYLGNYGTFLETLTAM